MDTHSKPNKTNQHRILPYSKSIDLNPIINQENKVVYPAIETSENDAENQPHTIDDRYFMKRSTTQSLFHCVSIVGQVQEVKMNLFLDLNYFTLRSKLIRFLIIFKVLASIIYFYASPISLIILIPELIGYFGVRRILGKAALFYGIWIFVELMLRIVVIVILGLDTILVCVFAISIIMIPVNFLCIYFVLKFYNSIIEIDEDNRQIILYNIGLSLIPP